MSIFNRKTEEDISKTAGQKLAEELGYAYFEIDNGKPLSVFCDNKEWQAEVNALQRADDKTKQTTEYQLRKRFTPPNPPFDKNGRVNPTQWIDNKSEILSQYNEIGLDVREYPTNYVVNNILVEVERDDDFKDRLDVNRLKKSRQPKAFHIINNEGNGFIASVSITNKSLPYDATSFCQEISRVGVVMEKDNYEASFIHESGAMAYINEYNQLHNHNGAAVVYEDGNEEFWQIGDKEKNEEELQSRMVVLAFINEFNDEDSDALCNEYKILAREVILDRMSDSKIKECISDYYEASGHSIDNDILDIYIETMHNNKEITLSYREFEDELQYQKSSQLLKM